MMQPIKHQVCGGLDISGRGKALEDENRKLKKLLAESMLDNAAPEAPDKKMVGPPPSARLSLICAWARWR
jgi:hypothetical protein